MLLPVRLRKPVTVAWLSALSKPITDMYARFWANRAANTLTLQYNSQVVYLQAVLNNEFDHALRRIYITDGSFADPLYVYLAAETNPLWLGLASEAGTTFYPSPRWLYTHAEAIFSMYNFIVHVPADVLYDEVRFRALIDKYRLPSKGTYAIVTF